MAENTRMRLGILFKPLCLDITVCQKNYVQILCLLGTLIFDSNSSSAHKRLSFG